MCEIGLRGITVERQVPVRLVCKGVEVGTGAMDVLVEGWLVTELKACETVHLAHQNQPLSYLHASGHPLGFPMNFHAPRRTDSIRRVALTDR